MRETDCLCSGQKINHSTSSTPFQVQEVDQNLRFIWPFIAFGIAFRLFRTEQNRTKISSASSSLWSSLLFFSFTKLLFFALIFVVLVFVLVFGHLRFASYRRFLASFSFGSSSFVLFQLFLIFSIIFSVFLSSLHLMSYPLLSSFWSLSFHHLDHFQHLFRHPCHVFHISITFHHWSSVSSSNVSSLSSFLLAKNTRTRWWNKCRIEKDEGDDTNDDTHHTHTPEESFVSPPPPSFLG